MPSWGLTLLFVTAIYFVPLVYITNQELIDGHLATASNLITEQTNQVRDLASQHTNKAVEMSSAAFKDYSSKAQEMIGATKQSAVDKGYVSQQTADKVTPTQTTSKVTSESFPSAPEQDPVMVQPVEPKGDAIPAL